MVNFTKNSDIYVDTSLAGYEALRKGTMNAYIGGDTDLRLLLKSNLYCNIGIVGAVKSSYLGFALSKGSNWREPINNVIRKYHEHEKLADIQRKYLASKCKEQSAARPEQFDLLYLSGVCALLVVGLIVSFIVVLLEHVIAKFSHVHLRDRKSSYNVRSAWKNQKL